MKNTWQVSKDLSQRQCHADSLTSALFWILSEFRILHQVFASANSSQLRNLSEMGFKR